MSGPSYVVLGLGRSRSGWLRSVVAAYVELIRNTPFLVQIYLIFFGLPSAGIKFSARAVPGRCPSCASTEPSR